MSIILVTLIVFALTLGAGLVGLFVHKALPEDLKNDSARSVVGQVAGLVSLLLALVLGTMIGTSFAFAHAGQVDPLRSVPFMRPSGDLLCGS